MTYSSEKTIYLAVVLLVALLLVFISCDDKGSSGMDPTTLLPGNFWANDFKTNRNYRVDAELLVQGTYCTVWAEKGSGVDQASAKQLADVYDKKIYNDMIDAFNVNKSFPFNGGTYSNVMTFADAVGDGNGKLCILMLDIRDSYNGTTNKSYVAGYFTPWDLFNETGSNRRDMIYIDTNPGFIGDNREKAYKTLAHEMQHLMNFVASIAVRSTSSGNTITSLSMMDLWIDEGLSSAAEWLYMGEHTEDRYKYVNDDESGLIKKGNNFFVWGNRDDEDVYGIMDEYYTVYLFFQWLRLQSNEDIGIYKNIISSPHSDYRAVTYSAYNKNDDWGALLRDWLAANYINDSSGRYGYKGDSVLSNVKFPLADGGSTSIDLWPGEGVYSYVNSSYPIPSSSPAGISYTGLKDKTVIPSGSISAGGVLLTYNADTNIKGSVKSGEITGAVKPSISIVKSVFPGSGSGVLSGPYPVGAHDVLRQRGIKRDFSGMNFSMSLKGAEGE
jgi:hypothetical protein